MVTLIFLRGLCGYAWVNILTLSPPRGCRAETIAYYAGFSLKLLHFYPCQTIHFLCFQKHARKLFSALATGTNSLSLRVSQYGKHTEQKDIAKLSHFYPGMKLSVPHPQYPKHMWKLYVLALKLVTQDRKPTEQKETAKLSHFYPGMKLCFLQPQQPKHMWKLSFHSSLWAFESLRTESKQSRNRQQSYPTFIQVSNSVMYAVDPLQTMYGSDSATEAFDHSG